MKRARPPQPSLYNVEPLDLTALANELELSVSLRDSVLTTVDQWDELPKTPHPPPSPPKRNEPLTHIQRHQSTPHLAPHLSQENSENIPNHSQQSPPVKLWQSIKRLWVAMLPGENRSNPRNSNARDARDARDPLRTSLVSNDAFSTPRKLKKLNMGSALSNLSNKSRASSDETSSRPDPELHSPFSEQLTPEPPSKPLTPLPVAITEHQSPSASSSDFQHESNSDTAANSMCDASELPLPTVPSLTLPRSTSKHGAQIFASPLSSCTAFAPASNPSPSQPLVMEEQDDAIMAEPSSIHARQTVVSDNFEFDIDESDLHPDAFPTEEAWTTLTKKINPRKLPIATNMYETGMREPASAPPPVHESNLVRKLSFGSPPQSPYPMKTGPFLSPLSTPRSQASPSPFTRKLPTPRRSTTAEKWNLRSAWAQSPRNSKPRQFSPWCNEAQSASPSWGSQNSTLARETERMAAQRRRITGDPATDRRLAHLEALRHQLRERRRMSGATPSHEMRDLKSLAAIREERRQRLIEHQRRLSSSMRAPRVGNVPKNMKLPIGGKRKRLDGRGSDDSPTSIFGVPHFQA